MFPELSANCYHLSWHLSALVWFILLHLLDFLNLAYFSYFSDPSFRLGVLPQGQKLPSVFYTALGLGMRKNTDSRDTCWLMCWESKHGDRVGLRARNPSWVAHHASSWRQVHDVTTSWRLSKEALCVYHQIRWLETLGCLHLCGLCLHMS